MSAKSIKRIKKERQEKKDRVVMLGKMFMQGVITREYFYKEAGIK